jgi:hypothetical protein
MRGVFGLLLVAASGGACTPPPVNTALVVRNLNAKCALIAFSGCPQLKIPQAAVPPPAPPSAPPG